MRVKMDIHGPYRDHEDGRLQGVRRRRQFGRRPSSSACACRKAAAWPVPEIDAYTQFVGIYGAKGLAYIKVNEKAKGRDGLQSPIVKNLRR